MTSQAQFRLQQFCCLNAIDAVRFQHIRHHILPGIIRLMHETPMNVGFILERSALLSIVHVMGISPTNYNSLLMFIKLIDNLVDYGFKWMFMIFTIPISWSLNNWGLRGARQPVTLGCLREDGKSPAWMLHRDWIPLVYGSKFWTHTLTMWGPLVINWFINPVNYNYKYHKPKLL